MRTVTGAAPIAFHDGRAGSGKQVTEVTRGLTLPQKGASVSEGGAGGRIGPGGPTGLQNQLGSFWTSVGSIPTRSRHTPSCLCRTTATWCAELASVTLPASTTVR